MSAAIKIEEQPERRRWWAEIEVTHPINRIMEITVPTALGLPGLMEAVLPRYRELAHIPEEPEPVFENIPNPIVENPRLGRAPPPPRLSPPEMAKHADRPAGQERLLPPDMDPNRHADRKVPSPREVQPGLVEPTIGEHADRVVEPMLRPGESPVDYQASRHADRAAPESAPEETGAFAVRPAPQEAIDRLFEPIRGESVVDWGLGALFAAGSEYERQLPQGLPPYPGSSPDESSSPDVPPVSDAAPPAPPEDETAAFKAELEAFKASLPDDPKDWPKPTPSRRPVRRRRRAVKKK